MMLRLSSVLVALTLVPGALALGGAGTPPKPGDRPSTARVALPCHGYHGDLAAQTADRWGYRSALWKVRLKRLTQLTVRWSQPVGGRIQLNELPGVITDRTWHNQEPVDSSNTGADGRAAFILVAAVPGWHYLDFVSPRAGTYSFALSCTARARLP